MSNWLFLNQAVTQAKRYVSEGCEWLVDMDIERFFNRVNHDILTGKLAKRIGDKRNSPGRPPVFAGWDHGQWGVAERWEGTPQGGPLSPLLSNILLDAMDKELERRGHRFCRYANGANIYVKPQRESSSRSS